jgi:long-chain fatty acid transport protein
MNALNRLSPNRLAYHGRVVALLLLTTLLVGAGTPAVFALGFRIPNQDPAAIARGGAFVATADNPSAIYYNPAGITQLEGHNVQANVLFYLNIYTDFEGSGINTGVNVENDPEILPVPALHYVFSPENSRLSYGLGIYAPFGLAMDWPDTAPFAPVGMGGRIDYVTINPVVAYQLTDTLSLAIGPTFNVSKAELRTAYAGPGSELKFKGDDTSFGFTAGVRWQPSEQWAFGATYRSATTMDYDGTASFSPGGSVASSAGVEIPQIIGAGISYRPTPKWNIEFNIDWTDWETLDSVTIANVGTIPFDWHGSFFYQVGVTRQFEGGWYASIGYFYSEDSTSETFYNPIVPDGDFHLASIGVGRVYEHWRWALAGQLIFGEWTEINNPAVPIVQGRYQLFSPTVSFSVGYQF